MHTGLEALVGGEVRDFHEVALIVTGGIAPSPSGITLSHGSVRNIGILPDLKNGADVNRGADMAARQVIAQGSQLSLII